MKTNIKKLLVLTAMFLAVLTLTLPFAPKDAKAATSAVNYTFTNNTITLSWSAPTLSSYQTLKSYSIYDVNTKTYIKTGIPASTRKYTVEGLSKGYVSYWRVEYTYTNSYGSTYTSSLGWQYVNTTPKKISTSDFDIDSVYSTLKKVSFFTNKDSDMTGTQLQLYKGKKKVKTLKYSSTSSESVKIKTNAVYKYRVRAYYTNTNTQKTYYGPWSSYKYFDCPSLTYSRSSRYVKVKLKKVSNVKSYTIYVSTKYSSGYKKFKTVTVSKTKTVKINKYNKKALKKGKTYYVKIVPNIKKGSKTVKSPTYSSLSFYVY
ncbi:MAG: hypothetical protein K6E13_02945 [Lachnospiraceae bacterium]|nr:hypothetical protein [Lachnospiraceae bacterium]